MLKHYSMTNKLVITALFLGLTALSYSQNKFVDKANLAYNSENYCEAADACSQAYTKLTRKGKSAQKLKADMAFKTAESYRLTERFREANEWYDRAIILEYYNVDPVVYYYNGEMLRIMNEKDKAIKNYKEFSKLAPGDNRGEVGIMSCNQKEDFVANKTRFTVENQIQINRKEFDMAPMFGDRKESVMYFGSSRDGSTGTDKDPRTCESYMDIWVSVMDKKNNWGEPKLIEGELINTEDNEGTVAFDGRGKTMFFTRCPNLKKQNLGCDIWVSEAKSKTEWKAPTKITTLKTHDTISVGHPCVSEDGKFLIFTSDMPGGYGGRDLWYSTYDKKSDSWTTPKNLGPEINTAGNDMFATFAKDGGLFYATDGKPGMGGLDIFKAEKVGEEMKWQNPKNMGVPINSSNNDYALIEHTDRKGYFTSERKSENGESVPDIWAYILPPNVFDLKIIVSDVQDKSTKIEDAKIVVTSSTGETWEGYTNTQGSVFWDKKPTGDRYINEETSYTIQVSKEGYHEDKKGSKFTTVGLKYDQNFVIDMALLPKKPIRLPEVRYPLAKWELLVDSTINSKDSLIFVYDLLNDNPGLVLELSSHTDSRGSTTSNQVLSENRAHQCYVYLVQEKGVDPRRIVPVGKGENDPRVVYRNGDDFQVTIPRDENGKQIEGYEEVKLTEALINSYKSKNKALFDRLHQLNRRTEGRVLSLEFDPETAPEAPKEYLEFKKVPR